MHLRGARARRRSSSRRAQRGETWMCAKAPPHHDTEGACGRRRQRTQRTHRTRRSVRAHHLRILVCVTAASLRVVDRRSFAPRGTLYDPSPLPAHPVPALRGGHDAIAVSFRPRGRTEVEITVLAHGTCTPDDVVRAFDAARGLAALEDDPTEFMHLAAQHASLARLARRVDARLPRTPT